MDQFTWVYGAIGAIGALGMAATAFLFNRISESRNDLRQDIEKVDNKIDEYEKKNTDRLIENERRFALKDDMIYLKEHMDKRFDQLGALITQMVRGGKL